MQALTEFKTIGNYAMEDIFKLNERKVGAPNSCFFNVVLEGYLPKSKNSGKATQNLTRKYGDGDEANKNPGFSNTLNAANLLKTSMAEHFAPRLSVTRKKPALNSLIVGITRFNEVMVETAQNCNKKKMVVQKEFEKAA